MNFLGVDFWCLSSNTCHWAPSLWRGGFLGAFAKFRKVTVSFVMSVRLSAWAPGLQLHDFNAIWCLSIFLKSVEKLQDSLKKDKNKGHFTWRPINIFDPISLIYSWNEKYFWTKVVEKTKTDLSYSITFLRKSCPLWDNVEKSCKGGHARDDNMTHAHCMLDKAINTHSRGMQYYSSYTATTVARLRLNVTLYVHCLSCSFLLNAFSEWHFDKLCPIKSLYAFLVYTVELHF